MSAPAFPCPDCGAATARHEHGVDVAFTCRCGWEGDYLVGEAARREAEQVAVREGE